MQSKASHTFLFLSFTNISPTDRIWGLLKTDPNGTAYWTGLVGDLASGKADFCASSLTMTHERLVAVDFTVSVLTDMTLPFVPNPAVVGYSEADINLDVFLHVFTIPTWTALLTIGLASSATYVLLVEKDYAASISKQIATFLNGANYFFCEMIQRGEDGNQLASISSKIFYLSLAALCFILFNFYVADLTATMTVGKAPAKLRSFQDILDKQYTLFALGGTFTEGIFKAAHPDSPMGKVYQQR